MGEDQPECKYCHSDSEEEMISCASCKQFSHPVCLELPLEIVPRVKTYDWQCNDCKHCYACHTIADEPKIVFCDTCDRGYHTYCAIPPMKRKPRGDWFCHICTEMDAPLNKDNKEAEKKEEEEEDELKEEDEEEEAPPLKVTMVTSHPPPPPKGKKKKETIAVDAEEEKEPHTKDTVATNGSTNEQQQQQQQQPVAVDGVTPVKVKRKYTKKSTTGESGEKDKKKAKKDEEGTKTNKTPKSQNKKTTTATSVIKETPHSKKKSEGKENNNSNNKTKESSDDDDVALAALTDKVIKSTERCMYANNATNQCPFVGCDGLGNTRNDRSSHVSISNCPLSREAKKKEILGVYASGDEIPLSQLKLQKEEEERGHGMGGGGVTQTPIEGVVSQSDIELFEAAKKKALMEMRKEMAPHPNGLKSIHFGNMEIEAWYKSQYPHEYSSLPRLYICEFCLDYMKTDTVHKRHIAKCVAQHPPGDEIYRQDKLSVFEVDGAKATTYCQNLCLMSKLFLDHKTLWHDVAPFLFYIMTESDDRGCHIIGYFSKEKQSFLNYNVSCILVLPHHMRKGYGKLLIDFSYLLTAVEGKTGSPERPFSDMGLMSYRKFWAEKLLDYISSYSDKETISIKGISEKMAMQPTDVISTLQYLGMLKYWKGKHVIALRTEVMTEYSSKVKQRPHDYKEIKVDCLKWKPLATRTTAPTK